MSPTQTATELKTSACPLDCPDSCSLEVAVEDGRVARIEGTRDHALTGGFICGKVRAFTRYLEAPERLKTPLRRTGPKGSGSFEEISWDAALDAIAARLKQIRDEHGGEAILPVSYGGSNGFLTHGTADERFFGRLGASRLARTICAAATTAAFRGLYGDMPGAPLMDAVHSRFIVLWGVNPSATGIHLVPLIQKARESGAALVVVDPRTTPLARQADLHLPVRPGTDLPLALSVIRWMFENEAADRSFLEKHCRGGDELEARARPWTLEKAAEVCGLEPGLIEDFARRYAAAEPAWIRCGWGLERNRNGGSAVAAVLALPAVAGKLGVVGGGVSLSNGGGWDLSPARAATVPGAAAKRVINMSRLGRALHLAKPPLKALFVTNANPLTNLPHQELVRQGLLREDLFTVVHEQTLTDTAGLADFVLPATTFLEHHELRKSYGSGAIQEAAPVIAPIGEARSNAAVFDALLRRLGLDEDGDPTSPADWIERILATSPRSEALRADLARDGIIAPPMGFGARPFIDLFPPHHGGRVDLVPEHLDAEAPQGLYAYQPPRGGAHLFTLISPALGSQITATFGNLRRSEGRVEVHPRDAAPCGINDGDAVILTNAFGEVRVRAAVTDRVRPGVLVLAKGLWARHTLNGATANALVPDHLSDLGGGACYNDARVELRRA